MKTQRWFPAVLLALGWLMLQPAHLRAEDDAAAGGAAEKDKKGSRGMWTFLWKADTLGQKLGEKLGEDQQKKVNATRDEIRQKFKNGVESADKQAASLARTEATEAYRTALKGILSQAQFEKLFPEKPKKEEKSAMKKRAPKAP